MPTAAYYEIVDESGAGGRYAASPATAGPWSPGLQHGGPPNALLVRAAERLAAAETGRGDLVALRLAAEFVGAVPVDELAVEARVVRAARTAVLVDVALRALSAPGRECLHGRVWMVRRADTTAVAPTPEPVAAPAADASGAGAPTPTPAGWDFPYAHSIEWVPVSGELHARGPAVVRTRPRLPVVAGEPLSGLQRVALVGDSSSGVSAELSWDEWSFVNVDLDVHLLRPVSGEWVTLDARTHLGGAGAALARSTVSDERGVVGTTAQTLVLAPLERAAADRR